MKVLNATVRILLSARRYAHERLEIQPDCPLTAWLSRHYAGFEPFIIIPGQCDFEPTYYCNVVMPERNFMHPKPMLGSGDERAWIVR